MARLRRLTKHLLSTTLQSRLCPRSHPYAQKTHHYTYRFQVPDSETYDVSWTQFTNDKLEKYNWNHLDQYVTTRGEEGFSLIEVSL